MTRGSELEFVVEYVINRSYGKVASGCALSDPRYSLLVLDGLDDVFAGGGAGGQEAGEDADKETGEKGC